MPGKEKSALGYDGKCRKSLIINQKFTVCAITVIIYYYYDIYTHTYIIIYKLLFLILLSEAIDTALSISSINSVRGCARSRASVSG